MFWPDGLRREQRKSGHVQNPSIEHQVEFALQTPF
jgi:hypothetical protein